MSCHIAIGNIENFKSGWAIIPFVGDKVHYWKEQDTGKLASISKRGRHHFYKSLCGVEGGANNRTVIVPGNFPRCKHCQRATRSRFFQG